MQDGQHRLDKVIAGDGDDLASEVITTYTEDGRSFEIDHLGIGFPFQWGQFAVYCGDDQVTTFAIAEDGEPIPVEFAVLRGRPPVVPAELPVTLERLAELAREAVKARQA